MKYLVNPLRENLVRHLNWIAFDNIFYRLETVLDNFYDKDNPQQVTLNQLKKVYRNGASAQEEKGLHAMSRVNMFLRMKQEGKITYMPARGEVESELKELVFETKAQIRVNTFVDITDNWLPVQDDFIKASEDIKAFELNYDFQDINELYLDDYEKLDIIWG